MRVGRMLFGPTRTPEPDPMFQRVMLQGIEQAKIKHYAEGMTDGVIMALESLLGEGEALERNAAGCYLREVPSDLEEWARIALENARAERYSQGRS